MNQIDNWLGSAMNTLWSGGILAKIRTIGRFSTQFQRLREGSQDLSHETGSNVSLMGDPNIPSRVDIWGQKSGEWTGSRHDRLSLLIGKLSDDRVLGLISEPRFEPFYKSLPAALQKQLTEAARGLDYSLIMLKERAVKAYQESEDTWFDLLWTARPVKPPLLVLLETTQDPIIDSLTEIRSYVQKISGEKGLRHRSLPYVKSKHNDLLRKINTLKDHVYSVLAQDKMAVTDPPDPAAGSSSPSKGKSKKDEIDTKYGKYAAWYRKDKALLFPFGKGSREAVQGSSKGT